MTPAENKLEKFEALVELIPKAKLFGISAGSITRCLRRGCSYLLNLNAGLILKMVQAGLANGINIETDLKTFLVVNYIAAIKNKSRFDH